MRVLEIIKRLILGSTQNDVYYHESGHVVVARIFDDIFRVNFVTANEAHSQQFDPLSKGALNGRPKKEVLSLKEANKVVLILLAGFCTDLINNYNGRITPRFFTLENVIPKLQQHSYSGDVDYIGTVFELYMKSHLTIKFENYLVQSISYLCSLLLTNEIWSMVNVVRNELKNSPNQTLDSSQLQKLFVKHRFTEWLSKQGNLIQDQEQALN